MRVLAIDPGFERCGVAIVERQRGKDIVLWSDCLRTSATLAFPERLNQLGQALEIAIADWQPTALAMEKLFFTNNQKTAMQVAEVRGMILYLASKNGLSIGEYTPLEIKVTITGFGRADKDQVTMMITKLVTMPQKSPENKAAKVLDDEYDAIAVGLTHLARAPLS